MPEVTTGVSVSRYQWRQGMKSSVYNFRLQARGADSEEDGRTRDKGRRRLPRVGKDPLPREMCLAGLLALPDLAPPSRP